MLLLYGAVDLAELANKLGKSYSTVRNWHTRDVVPEEYIQKAMREKQVSEVWLREGGGETPPPSSFASSHIQINKSDESTHLGAPRLMSETEKIPIIQQALQPDLLSVIDQLVERPKDSLSSAGWVIVPRYDVRMSAGPGRGMGQNHEPVGDIALNPVWMRRHFGRAGAGFVTAEVCGRSMEPTLFDGDTVVIDALRTDVDIGGVFALRRGDDVLVKRLQRKLNGVLAIISDNPVYQVEELRDDEVDSISVIGRVVWPSVR